MSMSQVRVRRARALATAALLCACGTTLPDGDAGSDASADVADVYNEGIFGYPDVGDVGSPPVIVYEGKDCGLPDVDNCHSAVVYTCCNGAVCNGSCVQFGDAAPECWCAPALLAVVHRR